MLDFFFHDTATTEIYTLSLHDALPISAERVGEPLAGGDVLGRLLDGVGQHPVAGRVLDRKSTRLNSSHPSISYAVFCLKKKKRSGSALPTMQLRNIQIRIYIQLHESVT